MLPIHVFVAFAISAGFGAACLAAPRHTRRLAIMAALQFAFWWVLTVNTFGDAIVARAPYRVLDYLVVPPWYQVTVRWLVPLSLVALFAGALRLRSNRAACLWLLGAACCVGLDWFYLAFEIPYELQNRVQVFQRSDLQGFRVLNGSLCAIVATGLLAHVVLSELAAKRRAAGDHELALQVHQLADSGGNANLDSTAVTPPGAATATVEPPVGDL